MPNLNTKYHNWRYLKAPILRYLWMIGAWITKASRLTLWLTKWLVDHGEDHGKCTYQTSDSSSFLQYPCYLLLVSSKSYKQLDWPYQLNSYKQLVRSCVRSPVLVGAGYSVGRYHSPWTNFLEDCRDYDVYVVPGCLHTYSGTVGRRRATSLKEKGEALHASEFIVGTGRLRWRSGWGWSVPMVIINHGNPKYCRWLRF